MWFSGKIFIHRKVVEQMNMDVGTTHFECNCNSLNYKYGACGHIVTGDLNIIKDVKVRNLILKIQLIGNKII